MPSLSQQWTREHNMSNHVCGSSYYILLFHSVSSQCSYIYPYAYISYYILIHPIHTGFIHSHIPHCFPLAFCGVEDGGLGRTGGRRWRRWRQEGGRCLGMCLSLRMGIMGIPIFIFIFGGGGWRQGAGLGQGRNGAGGRGKMETVCICMLSYLSSFHEEKPSPVSSVPLPLPSYICICLFHLSSSLLTYMILICNMYICYVSSLPF